MTQLFFPALAVASKRLGLDWATEFDVAEGVLGLLDAGIDEQEALQMTLREAMQRKGRYHGILKILVDTGVVFQVTEDYANADGCRNRRHARRAVDCGRGRMASGSPATRSPALLASDD